MSDFLIRAFSVKASSKPTVEASMTKKEAKDFYHEMKTKHDDTKAKVDELTKKREDHHKKVGATFDKMVADSDKKAHKDAKKTGHKEGSLEYKRAFSDAHMDHLLSHPDNDKHTSLINEGNKIYGELQHHKNMLKMHKIGLKNAKKIAKSHGITTASVVTASSKCPVKAAQELGEKISKYADRMARKNGFKPSADEHDQDAYDRAVIDYTANHPEYDRWADLSLEALKHGGKTEASVRDNETTAFLGFTKTKEPHTFGKTASEAKSNAKHWTNKANSLHDKIHGDAVKKAKKSGFKPGHPRHDSEMMKHMKSHPDHDHFQNVKKISRAHREHYKKGFSGTAPAQHSYMV